MDKIEIRDIRMEDDNAMAKIICKTLKEFKADKPGTAFYDDSTDNLFECFKTI